MKIILIYFALFSNYNRYLVPFKLGIGIKNVWNIEGTRFYYSLVLNIAKRCNWCKINYLYIHLFQMILLSLSLPFTNLKRVSMTFFNIEYAFFQNKMTQRWQIMHSSILSVFSFIQTITLCWTIGYLSVCCYWFLLNAYYFLFLVLVYYDFRYTKYTYM